MELIVTRVRAMPTWFPANILYSLVGSTQLHPFVVLVGKRHAVTVNAADFLWRRGFHRLCQIVYSLWDCRQLPRLPLCSCCEWTKANFFFQARKNLRDKHSGRFIQTTISRPCTNETSNTPCGNRMIVVWDASLRLLERSNEQFSRSPSSCESGEGDPVTCFTLLFCQKN